MIKDAEYRVESVTEDQVIELATIISVIENIENLPDDPRDLITMKNILNAFKSNKENMNKLLDGYTSALMMIITLLENMSDEKKEYIESVTFPYNLSDDVLEDIKTITESREEALKAVKEKEAELDKERELREEKRYKGYFEELEADDIAKAEKSTKH